MQTYSLPRDELRALLHLAAKGDFRTYLNGICVEISASGDARMVATNGHILGVIKFNATADTGCEPCRVIIPRDIVAAACKGAPFALTLERMADPAGQWQLGTAVSARMLFAPLEGTFPDYVRVVPLKTTGVASHANQDYVHAFTLVAKSLGRKPTEVRIGWNHDAAALVEIRGADSFCGVLMPLRTDSTETPTAPPAWALERIQTAPAATCAA